MVCVSLWGWGGRRDEQCTSVNKRDSATAQRKYRAVLQRGGGVGFRIPFERRDLVESKKVRQKMLIFACDEQRLHEDRRHNASLATKNPCVCRAIFASEPQSYSPRCTQHTNCVESHVIMVVTLLTSLH
jgi:hypothetical protein